MLITAVSLLLWLSVALAVTGLFLGYVFGLVAVPTVTEKRGWKYFLLITAMVLPLYGAIFCLANYKKTTYASNFILMGLGFAAFSGLLNYTLSILK
ncbi:hypothetical protein GCM10009007_10000 [Formosimonas limnophila]|uniref:Uncharacterized protein n=1 Tax=Formosimonas limnophila TaxID=1384487 RepID=A0A8J3CH25_9BURK|nr:hypothetical protein [Formosimonas limnophila]GHA71127.1 hypothetical protein GCM10009007_10000 [Formosimonas limnophila]